MTAPPGVAGVLATGSAEELPPRIRANPDTRGLRAFPRGFGRNRGGRSSAEPIAYILLGLGLMEIVSGSSSN